MSSAVLISLTAIVLASALVIVAWKSAAPTRRRAAAAKPAKAPRRATHQRQAAPDDRRAGVRLVVRATRGDSGSRSIAAPRSAHWSTRARCSRASNRSSRTGASGSPSTSRPTSWSSWTASRRRCPRRARSTSSSPGRACSRSVEAARGRRPDGLGARPRPAHRPQRAVPRARARRLGFEPARLIIVGDDADELDAAFHEGLRYELCITSGGLGPTHDDRTVELLAQVTGRSWCSTRRCERRSRASQDESRSASSGHTPTSSRGSSSRRPCRRARCPWDSRGRRPGCCSRTGQDRDRPAWAAGRAPAAMAGRARVQADAAAARPRAARA